MKKNHLFFFILITIACNNQQDYYPEKNSEMSNSTFANYRTKLDTAYLDNNNFEVGVQLANLKAPASKVFEFIKMGINDDPENCQRVYDWFEVMANFKNNIVKSDTSIFLLSVDLCLKLLGNDSYDIYINKKKLDHQKRLNKRIKLDSLKFDQKLISNLKQIRLDDQRLRVKYDLDNLSENESEKIWKAIKKLDSINLSKIEFIFKEYGYPKADQVGYELISVPWLVLHHQSDIDVRDKYQKIIEENVGDGLLKTYNWRSNNIRLDK